MKPTAFVTSSDGTRIAVYDTADGPATTATEVLIAVHGYPDNATVWGPLVAHLDGIRVVTYDVRGAGASDKPTGRHAYRIDRLVGDLAAVADAVCPDSAVHLVGHDWGSVQTWPALTDPRLAGRIASFTSISGPSLDHVAAWTRRAVRDRPALVAKQALHSTYVAFFQLPALPEALARRGIFDRAVRRAEGRAAAGSVERSEAEFVNGLQLYRANALRLVARPAPQRVTVPVQVIALRDDPFLDPRLCREAPRPWVDDLSTVDLPGGHWTLTHRPELIAGPVADFVRKHAH